MTTATLTKEEQSRVDYVLRHLDHAQELYDDAFKKFQDNFEKYPVHAIQWQSYGLVERNYRKDILVPIATVWRKAIGKQKATVAFFISLLEERRTRVLSKILNTSGPSTSVFHNAVDWAEQEEARRLYEDIEGYITALKADETAQS